MQTKLEKIVEYHRHLNIKISELDELIKTLKTAFDSNLMESENCYYLQSLIHVIRQKSNNAKDFTDKVHGKIIRYKLDTEKISSP